MKPKRHINNMAKCYPKHTELTVQFFLSGIFMCSAEIYTAVYMHKMQHIQQVAEYTQSSLINLPVVGAHWS